MSPRNRTRGGAVPPPVEEPRNLTFSHTNGWTLSVARNIGGPGYSVIAFNTRDASQAFTFENGQDEAWCSGLSGLVTIGQEVLNALPPAPLVPRR